MPLSEAEPRPGQARRVAVVTGASSGIGAALARTLTAHGWLCVLLARREERLRELAAEIAGEYEVCDVADRDQVEQAADAVAARHSQLALLVNNAGMPGRADFVDGDPGRIEQVVRVNYLGGVWCLRAFLPRLLEAPRAHVVNIVSVAGAVAAGTAGPYAASKHAQLAFSRSATAALRPRGIRVHTVLPGFVETEGFPQRSRLRNPVLRRLVVDPDRVVNAILEAVARNRAETWVPSWYRPVGVAQALAPALLGRALGRPAHATEEKTGNARS